MAGRRTGMAMVVAGLALAGTGIVGQVASGDDQPSASGSTTTGSTYPPPTHPTTTRRPGADAAAEFVRELVVAIQTGDDEFKLVRLHPAVIDRYGEAICRTGFAPAQPEFVMDVASIGPLEPWDWVTDGLTTTIPDTIPVTVRRTGDDGSTLVDAVIHLADVEGEIRWFTDCGDLP